MRLSTAVCTDPSFQATTQLGSVAHNNQQQVSAWGKSRQVKKETEIKGRDARKMDFFHKLRMAPFILYKQGFCARFKDHAVKLDLCKGYWNP